MADTESLRQVAQARAPFGAWVGIVLLFALFGVIVLAIIGPSPRSDAYEQKRAERRVDKLKAVRDEDAKTLSAYAWIDKTKGTARIPIERAMELTMADLKQKKPAPAGPITTPPPSPQAAPPAPSAAPNASPSPSGTAKPTAVAGPSSEAHNQPAAAANPPAAPPGTQPGAAASPAASPPVPAAKPAVSPSATPAIPPPGSPLPVRGKATPTPTPS
jgi:hypothetical protein